MSNFIVQVEPVNTNFIVEILEPTTFTLDISSGTYADLPNISLEIVNTEKILLSDLPDEIPMSMIVGNLSVSRIEGLSEYLDSYEFDCGSP